jgi:hypothetical protein
MNGRSQMQEGILPKKEINANRSRLEIWKNHLCPSKVTKWRERGYRLWMRRSGRRLLNEECRHCCCFYINIKKFEECVKEETAYLATLKSKYIELITFSKRLQRLKQEWQKSPAGTRQTDGKNLIWFGEIERLLLITYFYYFHHSITQINSLTGAIISETYIRHILRMNIINDYTILHRRPPQTASS